MSRLDSTDRAFLYLLAGLGFITLAAIAGAMHSDYRSHQNYVACVEAGNSPADCAVAS